MLKFLKFLLFVIISLIVISCADEENSKKFRALGNDPNWVITIHPNNNVVFSMPEKYDSLVFENDEVIREKILQKFEKDDLVLEFNILDRECKERKTGKRYSNEVIIRVNGEKFVGCGEYIE